MISVRTSPVARRGKEFDHGGNPNARQRGGRADRASMDRTRRGCADRRARARRTRPRMDRRLALGAALVVRSRRVRRRGAHGPALQGRRSVARGRGQVGRGVRAGGLQPQGRARRVASRRAAGRKRGPADAHRHHAPGADHRRLGRRDREHPGAHGFALVRGARWADGRRAAGRGLDRILRHGGGARAHAVEPGVPRVTRGESRAGPGAPPISGRASRLRAWARPALAWASGRRRFSPTATASRRTTRA